MSLGIRVCDDARAYPTGDAQMQHPASVGNGQGLLHQGRGQRKRRVQEVSLRIASWNVGIVLDRELKNKVMDVKRVNDRVIVVKLLIEDSVLNVVSVYAPQTGCDDSMKEIFWEDFDAVIMKVPECEEIYIGGGGTLMDMWEG
ncbi:uncharacterized protein LOC123661778 [Melitaea cinxia]|uniref:uncharacterized protein LOC123661778 n=1 Tax=Melitaea cinxia TaxID=113334 RepID=UPI001E26FD1E|nr:uncharacterized protein LOC123661778 [Melitaea cinxia]